MQLHLVVIIFVSTAFAKEKERKAIGKKAIGPLPKPVCPSGLYLTPTSCAFTGRCPNPDDQCINGRCCSKAPDCCPSGYSFTHHHCLGDKKCPPGTTCFNGRCCSCHDTPVCLRGTYWSGTTCGVGMPCIVATDVCYNGKCCRKPASTCPKPYFYTSLVCTDGKTCPPNHQCIKGRCCRKHVSPICPAGSYYTGSNCPCKHPDFCYTLSGKCCRKKISPKCPDGSYYTGSNCPCKSPDFCHNGIGCCRKKISPKCPDGSYYTGSNCPCKSPDFCHNGIGCCRKEISPKCPDGSYYTGSICPCKLPDFCHNGIGCCRKKTPPPGCPKPYYSTLILCPTGMLCPTTSTGNDLTCISGRCCRVTKTCPRKPYTMSTSFTCVNGRVCPPAMICYYGRCCQIPANSG